MAEGVRDRVHCTACDGTGQAPLTFELQVTLDLCRELDRRGAEITSIAIAAELPGILPTAVNNRLASLEEAGFMVRRAQRSGRRVVFDLAEQSPAPSLHSALERLVEWSEAEMVHIGHLRALAEDLEGPEGKAVRWVLGRTVRLAMALGAARSSVRDAARRIEEALVEAVR